MSQVERRKGSSASISGFLSLLICLESHAGLNKALGWDDGGGGDDDDGSGSSLNRFEA